jgi:hypothetical protein
MRWQGDGCTKLTHSEGMHTFSPSIFCDTVITALPSARLSVDGDAVVRVRVPQASHVHATHAVIGPVAVQRVLRRVTERTRQRQRFWGCGCGDRLQLVTRGQHERRPLQLSPCPIPNTGPVSWLAHAVWTRGPTLRGAEGLLFGMSLLGVGLLPLLGLQII